MRLLFGIGPSKTEQISLYKDINEWLMLFIPCEQVRFWRNAIAGRLFCPATTRYSEEKNVFGTPPADNEFVKRTVSIAKRLGKEMKPDTNMTALCRELSLKASELHTWLSNNLTHDEYVTAGIKSPAESYEKVNVDLLQTKF